MENDKETLDAVNNIIGNYASGNQEIHDDVGFSPVPSFDDFSADDLIPLQERYQCIEQFEGKLN